MQEYWTDSGGQSGWAGAPAAVAYWEVPLPVVADGEAAAAAVGGAEIAEAPSRAGCVGHSAAAGDAATGTVSVAQWASVVAFAGIPCSRISFVYSLPFLVFTFITIALFFLSTTPALRSCIENIQLIKHTPIGFSSFPNRNAFETAMDVSFLPTRSKSHQLLVVVLLIRCCTWLLILTH